MKMYIAVLDEFPDYMTPTLVAHSVLSAHIKFEKEPEYQEWLNNSFKKCVVRVNQKEFLKIAQLPLVHLGHEIHTLNGDKSCAVVCPSKDTPNVLKFAKLWKPSEPRTQPIIDVPLKGHYSVVEDFNISESFKKMKSSV